MQHHGVNAGKATEADLMLRHFGCKHTTAAFAGRCDSDEARGVGD